MSRPVVARTLERRLALAALLLGALAVFGNPYRDGGVVTIDERELARTVQGEVDHVTVGELADWIIQGRSDFRLLDLRDPGSYAAYHIPGAENVELTGLPDYPLAGNETIVLYSDGGIHAAQAWFLLRARGYRGAAILLGGLDQWRDEILFPAPPGEGTAADPTAWNRAREVAAFFGGTPRGAGADSGPSVAPPPLPRAGTGTRVAPPPRRKKKEGC